MRRRGHFQAVTAPSLDAFYHGARCRPADNQANAHRRGVLFVLTACSRLAYARRGRRPPSRGPVRRRSAPSCSSARTRTRGPLAGGQAIALGSLGALFLVGRRHARDHVPRTGPVARGERTTSCSSSGCSSGVPRPGDRRSRGAVAKRVRARPCSARSIDCRSRAWSRPGRSASCALFGRRDPCGRVARRPRPCTAVRARSSKRASAPRALRLPPGRARRGGAQRRTTVAAPSRRRCAAARVRDRHGGGGARQERHPAPPRSTSARSTLDQTWWLRAPCRTRWSPGPTRERERLSRRVAASL